MKKAFVILGVFALSGCVGYQINHYTPDVSSAEQEKPQYATDLSACRQQVRNEQDPARVSAESLIPVVGLFKAFDANDPSTVYGARKAISDCMKAKGYAAQSGS